MSLPSILQITSDSFTIFASGIAIYLFLFKRKAISGVLRILLTYTWQVTQSELKDKLTRLGELNVNEPTHREPIINILHEIIGQVRGNANLQKEFRDLLPKIVRIADNPERLTEPRKRSLVSEIRERLQTITIQQFDELWEDDR